MDAYVFHRPNAAIFDVSGDKKRVDLDICARYLCNIKNRKSTKNRAHTMIQPAQGSNIGLITHHTVEQQQ